jgi:hypothetical protein
MGATALYPGSTMFCSWPRVPAAFARAGWLMLGCGSPCRHPGGSGMAEQGRGRRGWGRIGGFITGWYWPCWPAGGARRVQRRLTPGTFIIEAFVNKRMRIFFET